MSDLGKSLVLVGLIALWSFAGYETGRKQTTLDIQHQAINRGYAQHNPTTGQWEWIDAESRQKSRQNVGIEPEEP